MITHFLDEAKMQNVCNAMLYGLARALVRYNLLYCQGNIFVEKCWKKIL